jgi:hypothetical protein
MNSSRIILAAVLLALAGAARAEDAKSDAKPAAKADAPVAAPADTQPNPSSGAKDDACPDLTGRYTCPAVARYKQKEMTITVKSEPAAKTYEFSYSDGSPEAKVSADGKRVQSGKTWSSYVCRDKALIQIVFKDAKTKKPSGGSKQRLDKEGRYEVTGPDGKATLLCPPAKAS